MSATAAGNNPYREKIRQFPGRIFLFEDPDTDLKVVERLRETAPSVFCELCSGSGSHLIERAKSDPTAVYFGVELRYKRSVRTIEKAKAQGVDNVYLLHSDAFAIGSIFPKNALDGIYINFPDPWEKRRSRKHRLLNRSFLKECAGIAKNDAFFSFKTDHRDYFEEVVDVFRSIDEFSLQALSRDLHQSEYADENVLTEFECLFLSQNLPIHFLRAIKQYKCG